MKLLWTNIMEKNFTNITVRYNFEDQIVEFGQDMGAWGLTKENDENRSGNEEIFRINFENGSGESEDLSISAVQSCGFIATDHAEENTIVIDDSSEDDNGDPFQLPRVYFPLEERPEVLQNGAIPVEPFDRPEVLQNAAKSEEPPVEPVDPGVKAFEDAMDDWHSKVSCHGHLNDDEIMSSARQLATCFSVNSLRLDNPAWLEEFKKRQKIGTKTSPDTNVSTEKSYANDNVIIADLNREDVDYPLLLMSACDEKLRSNDLYVSRRRGSNVYLQCTHPELGNSDTDVGKPKKSRLVVDHTVPDVKTELSPVVSVSDNGNAESITGDGLEGQMENQQCGTSSIRKPRKRRKVYGRSVGYEQASPRLDGDVAPWFFGNVPGLNDSIVEFESKLLDWYLSLTSQHRLMVAASFFEGKAEELAQEHNLADFLPTKEWTKMFMAHYGMWCRLDQVAVLLKQPEDGLLKYRLDVEFETWYHAFPTSPNCMIDCEELNLNDQTKWDIRKYMGEVYKWHAGLSSAVSARDISLAEVRIADKMGIPADLVHLVTEFYRDWYSRYHQFSESLKVLYNNALVPLMLPSLLKQLSSESAREHRLGRFEPSEMWMKRFLELNGVFSHENGVVHSHKFKNRARFEAFFRLWFRSGGKQVGNVNESQCVGALMRRSFNTSEPESQLKISASFTLQEPKIENLSMLEDTEIESIDIEDCVEPKI